jgi:SAM-dependent methyltransferase
VSDADVIWHDLECGAYTADLGVWRGLATRHAADRPVLDIGAGTGRVALDLARAGHPVIAIERDPTLAAELDKRAAGLPVDVRVADACAFDPGERVNLCIVPMQTIHLLDDRDAFLRCARAALHDGGLLAVALLGDGVAPFEVELDADVAVVGGLRYASTPTALRMTADGIVLERRRVRHAPSGADTAQIDRISLAALDAGQLALKARPAGFGLVGVTRIPPTDVHAGSDVAILEAQR